MSHDKYEPGCFSSDRYIFSGGRTGSPALDLIIWLGGGTARPKAKRGKYRPRPPARPMVRSFNGASGLRWGSLGGGYRFPYRKVYQTYL